MKKLIALMALVVVVSLPVLAGDVNSPGYIPPPPNPLIDEGDMVLFLVHLAL